MVREKEITLILRHVKGHEGTKTPRNAVNTWCDKECRIRMGQLIKEQRNDKDTGEENKEHTELQNALG